MFSQFRIVAIMALQNILLHRIKSLVVGGILFFGSLFLCLGLNLTQSVERSMAESIQGSLAGDFQLYDKNAKDKLALFGGAFFGREELGVIPDWLKVREELSDLEGIKALVPMGFEGGFIGRGNAFDELFQKLREFSSPPQTVIEPGHEEHIALVRKNLEVLKSDLESELKLTSERTLTEARILDVSKALSDVFWENYRKAVLHDPSQKEQILLHLDTKIAPISGEKIPIYLRYMGTDIELYTKSFSRFRLIKGALPEKTAEILLPERFYETELKNIAAVTFDKINEGIRQQGLKAESSAVLASLMKQLPDQYLQLVFAISPANRQKLQSVIKAFLDSEPKKDAENTTVYNDLHFENLIKFFLTVNSNNAVSRYDFFYQEIAPYAGLHDYEVGDTLFLRAYTRAGFLKTLPLKVSGVYRFEGLSRSDLAGATSIISLESYRQLYGVMSKEGRQELDELAASVEVTGDRSITDSASLEDSLFADPSDLSEESSTTSSQDQDKTNPSILNESPARKDVLSDDAPMAINMALVLENREEAKQVYQAVKSRIDEQNLSLQIVDWKAASGLVGQLITALTVILFISVFVIVVVGVAIINNSLMMSTLERTREIGTLRAIGASKGLISSLFLTEITILAAGAVYSGALVCFLIMLYLNSRGIPATSDFVVFLFSGPRLYPFLAPLQNFAAATVLLVFAVVSSAFPARFASRIEPAVAMQEKE